MLEDPIGNLLNQQKSIKTVAKIAHRQRSKIKNVKKALNCQWSYLPKAMLLFVMSWKKFQSHLNEVLVENERFKWE